MRSVSWGPHRLQRRQSVAGARPSHGQCDA